MNNSFNAQHEKKIQRLIEAFNKDNFLVDKDTDIFVYQGKTGIKAHHKTAVNYQTKEHKKAYYVEGSPYQMGYLMGLMAEKEVVLMTTKYAETVTFEFFKIKISCEFIKKTLYRVLKRIYKRWAARIKKDIPPEYLEEMAGIMAGCNAAAQKEGRQTNVEKDNLWLLNAGIDAVFARIYTGKLFGFRKAFSGRLNIPVFCNAFSIRGEAAGGGHYFGRDFMFPEAGVFQDTACFIIRSPENQGKKRDKPLPQATQTAPGMVGTAAGINTNGVAMGINVLPSCACNPRKPGFNSLLMVRHGIQYGTSADKVVEIVADSPRGVSWLYPVADGPNNKAGIIEAHCMIKKKNENQLIKYLLSFPPQKYKKYLPDKKFIKKNLQNYSEKQKEMLRKGLIVRWTDFRYPKEYLKFNPGLWDCYNRKLIWPWSKKKHLAPDALGERGHINHPYTDENCPSTFYFAPQRETRDDILVATNFCIVPEMRLPAMHWWTARVADLQIDDLQWRYDALNELILSKLYPNGKNGEKDQKITPIDYETAKELIDFLSPKGKYYPKYYEKEERSADNKEIAISGSINIFDMKKQTIESQFGYYCDEWVKLTLPNYFK